MKFARKFKKEAAKWAAKNFFQIWVFNLVLILLFLLRSAGYFEPFLTISVNFIIMTALILSILILGAKSRVIFLIALLFWLFAAFLRVVNVDVWAERTVIYTFEAIILGSILLVKEAF